MDERICGWTAEELAAHGACAAERRKRDRRERIATAALKGLLAGRAQPTTALTSEFIRAALELADALIAELDKT